MVRNSLVVLGIFLVILVAAANPGDKRTILTSGEKVHPIHYELGQSTILFFGDRPETVICGNNNYFHIEKIKEGLTIQPLSNFSTNLTVMDQGRRFLFYLTPAKGGQIDTFVDVRWIPDNEARLVANTASKAKKSVRELNQKLILGSLELRLTQIISMGEVKRTILEFTVKNSGKLSIKTSDLELLLVKSGNPFDHQISIFEQDELKPSGTSNGRLIVSDSDLKQASLVFSYLNKSAKIQLLSGAN